MREALVSIFGQEGAVVVQYIITFVVILALVGVAVWMGRRYAGSSVNVAGRGRLPRLAVIDALTVDKRRRLVLVRRDNVEHLLLIGGPSDIVVEPSITRTRVAQRPGQTAPNHPQALPATNAPQPAPPPPPAPPAQRTAAQAALRARAMRPPAAEPPAPPEEPIPFPPRRLQPRQTERRPVREGPPNVAAPEPTTPATRPAAQARSEPIPETPRSATVPPARDAQSLRPKAKGPEPLALPVVPAFPPDVLLAPVEEKLAVPIVEAAENHHPSAFAPPSSAGRHGERLGGENARHVAATEEPRRPPPGEPDREDDDDADTVGNLEKDMARLLGQISTGRPG